MYTQLNTILIPQDNSEKLFLKLAEGIFKNKKGLFHIDNKNYFIHVTLFPSEYPDKNLDKVIKRVKKIADSTKEITLPMDFINAARGYIGIEFKKEKTVYELHQDLVKKLNPLRENHTRGKYKEEMKSRKFSGIQKENIKLYGFHSVLSEFHPHLTLGRFGSQNEAEKIKETLKLPEGFLPLKLKFSYIAVSKMGPNGTCTEIIKKYKLVS